MGLDGRPYIEGGGTLQGSDALFTLAELAIGLAGFSGVVVAFARQGKLSPIDRWRFVALLSLAMGAAATAFVPSILHHAGVSGETLWRASSIIFLALAVPYLLVLPPRISRVALQEGVMPPKAFLVATFGLSAVNLGLQFCNVIGWPSSPGPSLLIAGLVIWLVVAAAGFGLLVLSRPAE